MNEPYRGQVAAPVQKAERGLAFRCREGANPPLRVGGGQIARQFRACASEAGADSVEGVGAESGEARYAGEVFLRLQLPHDAFDRGIALAILQGDSSPTLALVTTNPDLRGTVRRVADDDVALAEVRHLNGRPQRRHSRPAARSPCRRASVQYTRDHIPVSRQKRSAARKECRGGNPVARLGHTRKPIGFRHLDPGLRRRQRRATLLWQDEPSVEGDSPPPTLAE